MTPRERRGRILDALGEIFAEAGLDGVTMSALARRAGMSKRTLYDVFESRDALFAAYLAHKRSTFMGSLPPGLDDAPLAERLASLLAPRSIPGGCDLPLALLRICIAEGADYPLLARSVSDSGPLSMTAIIRDELDRAVARGEVRIPDTDGAAAVLRDMVRPSVLEVLLSDGPTDDPAPFEARFEMGLDLFLRGVGAAPRSA